MLLHLSLLLFIFFHLPLVFSGSLIAKTGCPDRCGNLSIPFPFGIGSKCYLDRSFDIICHTSINPPKAYLNINNNFNFFTSNITEVIEIKTSHIRVKSPHMLALSCYDMSGRRNGAISGSINLLTNQYTLSDKNWLTFIGWDDLGLGIGQANNSVGGSCLTSCAKEDDVGFFPDNGNGYSPGNACCRTSILKDQSKLLGRGKRTSCSYAFVQEKNQSEFSYPLSYLNNSTVSITDNPHSRVVVLDWRIGTENCSRAQINSTTFACQDKSHNCIDASVGGYLCHCKIGYEGNPYLTGSCQDINERLHSCDPSLRCLNLLGSYACVCRRGFYGYGRKGGTAGCIPTPPSKMNTVYLVLGYVMTGFLLVVLPLLLIGYYLQKVLKKRKRKKREEKFFKRNGGLLLQQQTTQEGTLGKTHLFSAIELEKATDHFNGKRILGEGGQGTVYKGMFSDGKIVAIKKSKLDDEDQVDQFINEVVILSQINHRNVVKLLGCCLETEVPLLVYEFMPNGTLFDHIHDPDFLVSWDMRLKIAADIAGALSYLHTASSVPIYHRDIKSSNILLDEKYIVKVSDFGTSRSVVVDQTHLTTLVRGTLGYLDPEYFQSGQFTVKSDVYSFGVVLVELLTGQKAISSQGTEEERSLVTRFLTSMEHNNVDTMLDPQVSEQGVKEEVMATATLARRCLNFKGKMRPGMKEVTTELESLRISSIDKGESLEEARINGAKIMMIPNTEYTWTAIGKGDEASSSSSDAHPFIFQTV